MTANMITILTVPTFSILARAISDLHIFWDAVHWALRLLLPGYCLGSALYLDSSSGLVALLRANRGYETSADKWALINVAGDALCLIFHLIAWSLMLYLIETKKLT